MSGGSKLKVKIEWSKIVLHPQEPTYIDVGGMPTGLEARKMIAEIMKLDIEDVEIDWINVINLGEEDEPDQV